MPDDVSVVGFDDSPAAAYATPGLATVRRPWPELGSTALAALLAVLLAARPPAQVEVPTTLVVRSSTGTVSRTA